MRICFLTSTPMNVVRGSGTFAGIGTLARAVRELGCEVDVIAPRMHFPVYTMERLWFNEELRIRDLNRYDVSVGFDMDGYRIAGRAGRRHVAAIKGVIADEMRFESGWTRRTMALQARCEGMHVRRARKTITTSEYAAGRLRELYGAEAVSVVPELIDLPAWRRLFAQTAEAPDPAFFTALSVCRFYPRKRLHLLLRAAAKLRAAIPNLRVRLVGGGPEEARLKAEARELRLDPIVTWLGDVSQEELAREYGRADVFALPSVQEGFGIVFLEAMAAGAPIVAARAAAVPEVAPQAALVEPESAEALADGIYRLWRDAGLRNAMREAGLRRVEMFDARLVAARFLREIEETR